MCLLYDSKQYILISILILTVYCGKRELPNVTKQKLGIAIMLPQDYIRLRHFRSCINNEIKAINSGNWSFLTNFYLESYLIIMHRKYNDIIETICSLLTKQVNTAIFINYNDYSGIEALNSKLFLKYASFINMPVMTFIPNAYQTFNPRINEIQLAPTLHHQAEAMIGLLNRYEWYKYSIIVTDFYGAEDFSHALDSLQYTKDKKKQFEILSNVKLKLGKDNMNVNEVKTRLKSINLETRVILLHCDIAEANVIFDAAYDMGMTTHEYIWIFTRSVIENPLYQNFQFSHFPIGSLALWFNTSVDGICKNVISDSLKVYASAVDKYYRMVTKENLNIIRPHTTCWNNTNTTFLNVKYHYGKNFHDYLLQTNTTKSQNHIIKFNTHGVLDSVDFKILNLNAKYEWNSVGTWSDKKITIDDIVWPGKAHKPPLGRPTRFHLKIVTLEEPPFVIYKDPSLDGSCLQNSVLVRIASNYNRTLNTSNSTHYKCASGFYIDLLIMLKDRLDFTFDIFEVEDRAWGAKIQNSWNGIIKDILTNKADIAMTSIKVTKERSEAIDFSIPFMETGIAIVVALRPGAISATAFLKPYDYIIWIMILLVILHSVAISVFLFEWLKNKLLYSNSSKYKNTYRVEYLSDIETIKNSIQASSNSFGHKNLINESPDDKFKAFALVKIPGKLEFTFGRSLWLIWVLLFRATTEVVQPTGFTSRFMSNVWACFCLAFMASYTANLAAFMITKEEHFVFTGVGDERLHRPADFHPSLRFGTVRHGSTEEVIKNNYPEMYKYMQKFMQNNIADGIKAVKENKIDAFLYDAVVLDYRSGQDDNCKLRVVGSWYSMTGYGIALAKGSKYKEMIDRKLLEYSYSGELERSQRFWFSGVCKSKFDDNNSGSHPLDVLNFTSAFILLLTGIVISILFLIIDHLWKEVLRHKFKKIWFYDDLIQYKNNKNEKIVDLTKDFVDELQYKRNQLSNEKLLCNDQSENECLHNCCSDPNCKSEIKELKQKLDYMKKIISNLSSGELNSHELRKKKSISFLEPVSNTEIKFKGILKKSNSYSTQTESKQSDAVSIINENDIINKKRIEFETVL